MKYGAILLLAMSAIWIARDMCENMKNQYVNLNIYRFCLGFILTTLAYTVCYISTGAIRNFLENIASPFAFAIMFATWLACNLVAEDKKFLYWFNGYLIVYTLYVGVFDKAQLLTVTK
jgi:hypothetical protein